QLKSRVRFQFEFSARRNSTLTMTIAAPPSADDIGLTRRTSYPLRRRKRPWLLLVKKAPHATHRSFRRRRYHSCWVLRREMQGCSIGTTVASKGLTYRSLRRVSDIEHWRSKEEQHEAQMGPIMSGCGALLGAHVCNGSSGSAPSSSPWRFSI